MTFGSVGIGASSNQVMYITNTGNSVLTVYSITYPTGFSSSWNGGSIAAGGTQAVTVYFSPVVAASYTGIVSISSNASSGVSTIACSGSGIIVPLSPSVAQGGATGGFGGGGGGGCSAQPAAATTCAAAPPKHGYGWLILLLALFGGAYYLLGEDKKLD